ncbi:MAG: DUF885 domain-containing protein [Pseudomonadota bacterium]
MSARAVDVSHDIQALHALFELDWEASARRYPEVSTRRGDLRFNSSLTDESQEAVEAFDAFERKCLTRARAIAPEHLSAPDRLSLALFIAALEREIEEQAFTGYRSLLLGTQGGAQSDFADLLRTVPMENAQQVNQLLMRISLYPRLMDQRIQKMRRGAALGWIPARPILDRVLLQIDAQLPENLESGPFFAPFMRMAATIPREEQEQFRRKAGEAILRHVIPAMRQLRIFVVEEYLPRSPPSGALSRYPDGGQVYDMLVRRRATTMLSPREIHAIGNRELERLRREMEDAMHQAHFAGGFPEFIEHLKADPKFYYTTPEAMLAAYRDIAKRIDAELPRLFAELPRAPYGVRAMPAFRGAHAAEYYEAPSQDGDRAGYFNANVVSWMTKPTWSMPTLTAHEAAPGHHVQVARALELRDLPAFRRQLGHVAFTEGWAVYAETLGREIGLYDDPYSLFGHLQYQAFRAARLVVDTGLHSLGWTRQQAIEFMTERTGMDAAFVEQEIDRYLSWPGQALGYMLGELKIRELRDRASARLGPRFDLRRFHNAVIDNGALPLDVLDRVIDSWIESQH